MLYRQVVYPGGGVQGEEDRAVGEGVDCKTKGSEKGVWMGVVASEWDEI